MLIWSDVGTAVVNFDNVAAVSVSPLQDGSIGIIAFCNGSQTLLSAGDETRARAALHAVAEAFARHQKILDLRDVLGQRPEPGGGLIVPQGVPAEAIKAAEETLRKTMGNGRS